MVKMFSPNARMGRNCDLSAFDRGIIVGARRGGLSITETADRLGFSRTTVSRVYREWCEKQKTSSERQFCGRKRLVNEKGQRVMASLVQADRKATVTQITSRYNSGVQRSISERTARRTLKWMGYSSRRPHRVPRTDEQKEKEKMASTADKPLEGNPQGFKICYVQGDLFSCPEKDALAHCISEDCDMEAGIAVWFKWKYGGVEELQNQKKKIGDVAVLKKDQRFIYYLITKKLASDKPTYDTLQKSLEAMRDHCLANGVLKISMPKIGCGLDNLEWDKVSAIIEEVFKSTNIVITVYSL